MPGEPKAPASRSIEGGRRAGAGRRIAATGDSLNAYIREIARFSRSAPSEEKELGRRIRNGRPGGAASAWSRPTCASWSPTPSATAGSGLSFLDLIHEGNARASSRRPSASTPSAT